DNIYDEAYDLFKKQPELIKAIPTILAIRDKRFDVLYIEKDMKLSFENLDFKTIDSNIELYVDFAYETGLLDFLSTKANKSLVDYVFGVEVGLDSNGRKNRSGSFMETLVEKKVNEIC